MTPHPFATSKKRRLGNYAVWGTTQVAPNQNSIRSAASVAGRELVRAPSVQA
jgi:hypothetical protein